MSLANVFFAGMLLLCVLPLPNCFLAVCFLKHFSTVLNVVLTVTTSAFSCAPKSEKPARPRFAAGTTCSCKKEIVFPQKSMRIHSILFIAVYQYLKTKKSLLLLIQESCSNVFLFAMSVLSQSGNQDKSCDTDTYKKDFLHSRCSSSENEYRERKYWQFSNMLVTKCPIDHVLSSFYKFPSFQ